jgi:hypothetical protein
VRRAQLSSTTLFIYVSFCLMFLFLSDAISSEKDQIEANILSFKDLCDLGPSKFNRHLNFTEPGKYELLTCENTKKKFPRPIAVRVNIKNISSTDLKINLPKGFTTVILSQSNGKKIYPLAFQSPVNMGIGPATVQYFTKDQNGISVSISPKEQDDLIFLFESANTGDLLKLDNFSNIKLK